MFAGSDSRTSTLFRAAHLFDTMVLIDPETFGARLEHAGFENVSVLAAKESFKFEARKPVVTPSTEVVLPSDVPPSHMTQH
jgi:hypothetical protein